MTRRCRSSLPAALADLQTRFPYQFQQWSPIRDGLALDQRPGWHGLFAELCEDVHRILSPVERLTFSWLAVSARFGAMRCYFAGELNPEVVQAVKEAEQRSATHCEICGNGATLRRFGDDWATRCVRHGMELAARTLLIREQRLSRCHEGQIERRLAQWMMTPDPRWGGQPPQVLAATALGATLLLELLMLQLEPGLPLH